MTGKISEQIRKAVSKDGIVTLDARLFGDTLAENVNAALANGTPLRLVNCHVGDAEAKNVIVVDGDVTGLRGQSKADEAPRLRLVVFDRNETVQLLLAVRDAAAAKRSAARLLGDFDADLDLVLENVSVDPQFIFSSTGAPDTQALKELGLADDGGKLAEGLNLGLRLSLLNQFADLLVEELFADADETKETLVDLLRQALPALAPDVDVGVAVKASISVPRDSIAAYRRVEMPFDMDPLAFDPGDLDDLGGEDEDETSRKQDAENEDDDPHEDGLPVMLALSLLAGSRETTVLGRKATLVRCDLLLPLSGELDAEAVLNAKLDLGHGSPPVAFEARISLLSGETLLRLIEAPSLDDGLTALFGMSPDQGAAPGHDQLLAVEGLPENALTSALGSVEADEAWVLLDPNGVSDGAEEGVVCAAGLVVTTDKPIELVPGYCRFRPTARLRIDDPFSDTRKLSGVFSGTLEIGFSKNGKSALEIDAELILPEGIFTASTHISVHKAAEAFRLDGISDELKGKQVSLDLFGDWGERTFFAELKVTKEDHPNVADEAAGWHQTVGGKSFEFRAITFSVEHTAETDAAPATTAFEIAATLALKNGDKGKETTFEVVGGYDDGWHVLGKMDGELDLSDLANELFTDAVCPKTDGEGDLQIADLQLSADLREGGGYSIRGRTEGTWKPIPNVSLELAIENVELSLSSATTDDAEKDEDEQAEEAEMAKADAGQTLAADIACMINLDQIAIRCRAVKKADEDGWTISGRTLQDIDLAKLASALDAKLHTDIAQKVPSDFTVTDVSLEAVTGKNSKVTFAIAGHLKVGQTRVEATLQVKTGSGSKGTTTVTGTLQIGDVPIEGVFLSEQDQQLFAGGFAPGEGKPPHFDLGGAVSGLLGDQAGAVPAFSIDLNRLIFVWRQVTEEKASEETALAIQPEAGSGAKTSGFVLDAALGTEIVLDLSETLPIGAALGIPRIELNGIEARYASAQFDKATLDSIKEAHDLGLGDAAIEKGFSLSGKLKVGDGEPLTLSLPPPDGSNDNNETPETEAGRVSNIAARGEPNGQDAPETAKGPDSDGAAKWINIDKSVGPLHVGRVGVGFAGGKLGIMLDSDVDLAGLHVGLTGFALHFALEEKPKPSVSLDGLALGYSGGPVTISGAFRRHAQTDDTTGETDTSYDGAALIEAAKFTIAGFGSYTTVDQKPSMFIYAVLIAELGGPPAFRVRGLAAGFGYNRKLTLPKVDAVQNFPLVKAVAEPGNAPSGEVGKLIDEMMTDLRPYVAPSSGDYWVAAGIRFNSFELIEAVALVSVSFGSEVEIGLLGLAQMSLPRGVKKGKEIAYAELALRASIKPEDGTAFIEGRLTEASFILSRSCRLTGGFALMFWFAGKNEGDFVVTLGGYHPRFDKPAHYPVVPRLGVRWEVTSELLVTAEMYFALTPHCVMAGGRLSAVYSSGRVRAWFIAHADFLLHWEPLAYTAEAGVTIGVEVDLSLFTVRVSLSVELQLWGPPFGGIVTVDLSVISFDIPFGADREVPKKLGAEEFEAAFLPDPAKVLAARITEGLLHDADSDDGARRVRVVTAHGFRLAVQSTVPIEDHGPDETALPMAGGCTDARAMSENGGAALGVAPMANGELGSKLGVELCKADGVGEITRVEQDRFVVTKVPGNVPAALWQPKDKVEIPRKPPAGAEMTLAATVGLTLVPAPPARIGTLDQMKLEQFDDQPLQPRQIPRIVDPGKFSTDGADGGLDKIMSDPVRARRSNILEALARTSPVRLLEPEMSMLNDDAGAYFKHQPIIDAPLGQVDEGAAQ